MRSVGWMRLLCIPIAAAAVVGFALLAPSSLGGSATWLSTSGNSMEPTVHAGDLVIARPQADYQVGDVVAHPSATLDGTVVLHRIVADKSGTLVTRGDNNDWLDPDQPQASQILGEKWLHIPGGGRMLTVLADPFVIAALVLTLLTVGGLFTVGRARRRGARRAKDPLARPLLHTGWPAQAAAGATVAAIALGWLAFGQPVDTTNRKNLALTHTAALTYSADASGSDIYADDQVRTGDPVFLAVTPVVDTGLRYELARSGEVSGTIRTSARVSAGNGWRRTVPIGAPTHFRGSRTEHRATVDLKALHAIGQEAERDAEITFGGYTLEIVHDIHVEGQVAGEALNTDYQPKLTFALDGVQAVPQGPTAQRSQSETLTLTEHDEVTAAGATTGTVTVLRWQMPVGILRALAIALAVASLLLVALVVRSRNSPCGPQRIFGRRLVHASDLDLVDRPVVGLHDPYALSRLARLYDTVVVAVTRTAGRSFFVAADNIVYRYDEPIGVVPVDMEDRPYAATAAR